MRVGKGSLVYVPKGNLHTHKNVGTTPGKMLVSQTPGGLYERFYEEIGQEAQDKFKPTAQESLLNAERIVVIAAMYGIEIPPSAPS
jgi:oxalate decarboxylase/phosphoglucose isomerase-like protein (cupin superfamily)